MSTIVLLLLLFLLPEPALSGHGFMTAFANIEWLPEPGRTPDSNWYQIDAWQEEGQLWLAQTPEAKISLCLDFAREKLAELEAMVKAENASAAEISAHRYQSYIDRARYLIPENTENKESLESLAESIANALLEHQYILSIIYEELPAETRIIVPQVIEIAQERYQEVSQLLSRKTKGALFFKEEEVRWSVQMALRADEEPP